MNREEGKMPTYNSSTPSAFGRFDVAQVLNENGISASLPYKSQQIALTQNASKFGRRLDVSAQFSGPPGAFSFVLETAAVDSDGSYIAEGAAIAAVDSANSVTQPREIPAGHNFARIRFTALANNVTATANLSPQ
jgi:hypothetical protein